MTRQHSKVLHDAGSRARRPGFELWLIQLQAVSTLGTLLPFPCASSSVEWE
jgi:hypothetical protein